MGDNKQVDVIVVILISGMALLGWWINHAALVVWLPGIANMTFNTALGFLLLSIACLFSRWRPLSIGVGLFAALSLLQDATGWNLGIDNLLFDSQDYGLTSPYPGRMSPNTAIAFVLSSICLLAVTTLRQSSRITTVIHALIILLGMLSLIGVGMTLLMTNTPQGVTHFASMSLFTAICFLLLSSALLRMYARQYRHRGVDALLYSVIQLMYHLKFPQKFTLISLVLIVPLGILMVDRLKTLDKTVRDTQLKRIAIEHIQVTSDLLKALPEHRGMLNAQFAAPGTFSDEAMRKKREEIDRLFARNALQDRKNHVQIEVPDAWPAIKERWNRIKTQRLSAIDAWRLHTEAIAQIARHLRDIGRITHLSYDSDPMVHRLVAAKLEIFPQLFEQIGQLRGKGVALLVRGSISEHEEIMLGSMISQGLLLLHEEESLFDDSQDVRWNQDLEMVHRAFVRLSKVFWASVERHLITNPDKKHLALTPQRYFAEGTQALDVGYDLSAGAMSLLKQIFQQRIKDSLKAQYTIKFAAVFIVLLILYLFWGFYRSIMNTIDAVDGAVRRMRDGKIGGVDTPPTHDEMGDVVLSFHAMADELMRVSTQMCAVVDNSDDGIVTIDEHGTILSFNPASAAVFDYAQDEVVGKNITVLMPERYQAQHQAGLQHYCQTGSGKVVGLPKPVMVHGLKKDGSEFPMELSISAMVVEGKQMFIGMIRDVSEREQMQQQLQHAQKMEAVGSLVGGVAHNFNNLLAGIVGKVYLAQRNTATNPEKVREHLDSIEDIAKQAGDMVKQLLTFAHKDFFRKEEDVPLAILIKEGLKTAKLGMPETIRVALHISCNNVVMHCDANQIQQVLMNNARDAVAESAEKKITVRLDAFEPDAAFLQRHADLEGGNYACLQVSDTGHGMDEATIERIFDPFYTTKDVGAGTGLGLSSAFGSVASHGGTIEVESELGVGSTFRVYLPLITSDLFSDHYPQPSVVPSLHHETILLVDDEKLVIDAMCEVLEDLGYRVLTARDGQEGLTRFQQSADQLSLVVTDVVMPEMGGVDMFREIRKRCPQIPTIFMTGYDDGYVKLSEQEKAISTVLSKPVQIAELSRTVCHMLNQSEDPA